MFWSINYKQDYSIQGSILDRKETIIVLHSPSGYGYDWKRECKSVHAAKIAVTKHIKATKQS